MIDLCTLGTGGSIPLHTRALASLYVRVQGRAFLLDCGEGTQMEIGRLGWGFLRIEALVLTHYHADHCSGVPGFLLALAKAGKTEPFAIYGPPGLRRVIEGLRVIAPQLPYALELHELPFGEAAFEVCGLQAASFALDHGMPCLGYRFDLARPPKFDPEKAQGLGIPMALWGRLQQGETVELPDGRTVAPEAVMGPPRKGLSFLYATDTRPVPAIAKMGEGTDLMFLEGMYGEEEKLPLAVHNHHMIFRESAALAAQAGTKRLILTHFSTSLEEPEAFVDNARAVFPETVCATDGMVTQIRYEGR